MTPVGATTTPTTEAAVTQQNRDESPAAALTSYDTQWFEADQSLLDRQDINGPVVRRLWSI
jgi:hypothetical protein